MRLTNMAETTGFEPVVGVTYNDLANRRFQPLSHVSGENRIFHSSRQANFVKARRIEFFEFNKYRLDTVDG